MSVPRVCRGVRAFELIRTRVISRSLQLQLTDDRIPSSPLSSPLSSPSPQSSYLTNYTVHIADDSSAGRPCTYYQEVEVEIDDPSSLLSFRNYRGDRNPDALTSAAIARIISSESTSGRKARDQDDDEVVSGGTGTREVRTRHVLIEDVAARRDFEVSAAPSPF